MNVSDQQAEIVKSLLKITREEELNCNELLEVIGEYAEQKLSEQPIDKALEPVEHHLNLCRECEEEYAALCKALQNIENH